MKNFVKVVYILLHKYRLVILTLLVLVFNTLSISTDASLLNEYNLDKDIIYPTKDYNVIVQVDTITNKESYTINNRNTGKGIHCNIQDGKVIDSVLQPAITAKDILEPESMIVYPEPSQQYYTYVTLLNPVHFITQYDTGRYSSVNCVPTCVAIVNDWIHGNFEGMKVADIRSTFTPGKESGYTIPETETLLKSLTIPYTIVDSVTVKNLIAELNQGKIILAHIYASKISQSNNLHRTLGISASIDVAHCILITGYMYYYNDNTKATNLYLEICDPSDFKETRRFFKADETIEAITYINNKVFSFNTNQLQDPILSPTNLSEVSFNEFE